MNPEHFSRLEAIQQHIESAKYEDYSPALRRIYDELIQLNAWKSFTGRMMAEAKRDLHIKKTDLYQSVINDPELKAKISAPSVIKDYISARCYDMQYEFDFSERVNSSLGYAIETLRSILSATKTELTAIA